MTSTGRTDRIAGALGTALLQALLLYALLHGVAVTAPPPRDEALKLIDLPEQPPAPFTHRLPPKSRRREGAASPANLRARATEIVAPVPMVPRPPPSPVIAAPVARDGYDASAGAADVPGPGYGSGGVGNGWGGGGRGDGDGAGETPPRRLRGSLRNSDFPRAALEAGAGGTVSVRYRVATSGRVTECRIDRSSGNADLDETTCRLIVRRFRFDPSRDAAGRPVDSTIVEEHEWFIEQLPPEEERR